MATDQTYRMPYPRSQVGHQMYDVRTQGLAIAQGHLPNLPHSATSAFRPAFVPQVPLQQRLVSPRVIPSNQEQYHQQRTVPFGSSGKHAVQLQLQHKQLELHQKQHQKQQQKQQQQLELHQKQQQHVFQTLQATIPANGFQELSMDVHQRAATNPAVQPAAPVQYPPITHQFSAAQGTSDHEILHQELRMLHAAHYQEKNRKDELLDAYMTQQMVEEKKQQIQTLDTQRKLLSNNNAVFRKKFFEETQTYVQQAQPMYLPKQEELYQARKARVPLGSAVPPTHPQMASYPHAHPETRVRLDGPMQHRVPQTVPQTRLVQAIKEGVPTANNFVARPGNYQNFHLNQRFGVPQQYQPRGPGVMMPHQPVQYTHQEVFQSQRRQRDFSAQLQAANLIHSEVQHQPQKQPNFPLQYRPEFAACMMRDNIAQMPVTSHVGQVKQEQTMDIRAPMPGHMHSLPGQILRNRILENEVKVNCTDNDSKESRRLSKMAVSIREEQMQLKEVLEKSLHRAAVQSIHKGVTENIRDSSSHIIAGSSCDNESMPRIVEVRSLANQESNGAVPGAHLIASKEAVLGISPGDVLGSNLKPSKPKSVMIKAHQELQEVPLNVNRVPSIGSLDSDNGRKDSWDSGIESPPWPENREACVMNMKRAASFPCDDMASLSIPHQSQKEKVVERKQSDNSIVNVGMDLSAKDQTNRADVLCNSLPEASNRNRQLSGDEGEKRSVSRGPVRLMNRKRSLPVDDVCPVEPKVLHCDPQALDYSKEAKLNKEYVPEENILSKAGNSVKGQPATTMVVVDESPLDLSLKKDQQETSIEIEDMEEVQLDENEVTIEKKPNVDEIEEDEEEIDSKMKRGETCDGEKKEGTDEAANDANEMVIQSPENQMQGYFGTIMMRALKRLWSESKTKLEGEDAAKAKPEGVESSDEDSGKYFQPSSVTTLENVPRVDSPVGLPLSLEHESVKNMLSSSSSSHSLETALCELMQQSSDAFKHGGDIFKHFDKIIKRELMIEIGKRPLKCNDESTTTESKQEETPSVSASPDLIEVEPDEQTSEAVPLDSISPVNMLSEDEEIDDEIDDSQKLVIVESCLSPKPLPDSQETERKMEQETVPVPTPCAPQTSIAAGSPVRKSFRSSRQTYEKAARDAAQKAAHEAARLAAQKGAQMAAQKALTMKESGISQAQGGQTSVGDVTDGMIISSEASLPPKLSPVPSPGQPNLKASMYPGAQGGPRINFHQLQNNRRAATAFVKQPQAPRTQRPQFMGKDIPNLVDVGEGARDGQSHACVERRYSEPATFNLNSTDSSPKDKLQRMMSDGSLSITPVKNDQTIAPSSKRPTARNTYHANPQTIWQAQAQENNDNKVKLVKVTYDKTIPGQVSPTLSGVPNAQDIQKHLQKSPIVLLPKLVFVPGQTFQQLTPVSGAQAFQPGNILLLHKDKRRSVSITTAPVLPTVSVQGLSNNAAPLRSSNSPLLRIAPEAAQSPDFIDTISGPFRIIRKTPVEHSSSTKKAFISAFIIVYKNISLPGVLRSAVPFVPPRLLQNGMFPEETFENFCHALQDCNIMQRYMTVLERSALLNDLKHNKISSCKLVSLGEFHQKYDNIKELMQINKMT